MPKSRKTKQLVQKPDQCLKYTGELAEPIYEPDYVGGLLRFLNDEIVGPTEYARLRGKKRQVAKLKLLFEWYGVELNSEDRWLQLAFSLAKAHVPGMRVIHNFPPRRGRKPTWKTGLAIELLRDVDALQRQQRMRINDAIKVLREDGAGRWGRYTQGNLVTRHREARRAQRNRLRREKEFLTSHPEMDGLLGLGLPKSKADDNS